MMIQELEKHLPYWYYDFPDQLKNHVYERSEQAFAAGDAARDSVTTLEQLQERQRAAREALLEGIGGLPPSDTPLDAEIVGVVEGNGFHIEKVVFQSRPQHYVTANLYLPDDTTEPRGAVLFLCGHHELAKHVPEYQRVCQYLVQAGLVVLAQDPIGQGERFSYYEPKLGGTTIPWGTGEHEYTGLQCWPLGDGIARYFLHDAMRGIDYLCSRPEVDPKRIGATGNSGGGTQTSLLMMAEPRLAAAVPGTFVMNRQTYMWSGGAQDAEQIWPGLSAKGFDHEEIVLPMAPRPVRVLAVTADFFPIEGTRRTVERCKRFWELSGKSGDLDLVEDVSTHLFTTKLARAATEFFARHLLDKEVQLDDARIEPFDPQKLWCTKSGQVRADFSDAAFVYEENRRRAQELSEQRESKPENERLIEAKNWLRSRVMNHRKPCDANARFYDTVQSGELSIEFGFWWSQEKILNTGFIFRHFENRDETLPVTLAVWDGGTRNLQPHLDWLRRTCASQRAVFVPNVTGAGAIMARPKAAGPPEAPYEIIHKLGDDLFWLDDDLAVLRTYDVLSTLAVIEQHPKLDAGDINLYAYGRHGVYGRFAAALDSRIRETEVAAGLPPYSEWVSDRHFDSFDIKSVILRGMLQYFDLPDLESMKKL